MLSAWYAPNAGITDVRAVNRAPVPGGFGRVRRAALRLWHWHSVPASLAMCQLLRIFLLYSANFAKPSTVGPSRALTGSDPR
ncbi:hypothetical protein HDC93_005705 [Streptomyces sp. AK010]|nr:hypothetical protein [Streptomyces sp. AK010]